MRKRILLITLTLLFALSCSVYADTDYVKEDTGIDDGYPIIVEVVEDSDEISTRAILSPSITVDRVSTTKLSFGIATRIGGAPDSLRMTATLYKKSGSSYNYTGKYKSTTKSKPSGTIIFKSSFAVTSGTYKVKVTLTEIKGGKENKVIYWSSAA